MDTLLKFFPVKAKAGDTQSLITAIVIYVIGLVAVGLVWSLIGGLLSLIPVIGGIISWILGIACGLIELYLVVGLVFAILIYCNVIKQ